MFVLFGGFLCSKALLKGFKGIFKVSQANQEAEKHGRLARNLTEIISNNQRIFR